MLKHIKKSPTVLQTIRVRKCQRMNSCYLMKCEEKGMYEAEEQYIQREMLHYNWKVKCKLVDGVIDMEEKI